MSIVAGQFGIFFLKDDPRIGLTVTNPVYPFIVSTRDPPTTQGDDFERVVGEIAKVLVSNASMNDKLAAIITLDRVNTRVAREALREATQSSHVAVRLQGVATLLRQNDTSQLSLAETILLDNRVNAAQYLILNVALAVSQIRDPRAIPALTRLLESRYVEARRSAAEAIANTGGSAAIKPLAKALYDSDRDVRHQAVRGLAMITGQDSWYPSIEWFEDDERRFLTYWRNWAKGQ